MLYFSWLVGLSMAALFAVVIGMWFEVREETDIKKK